MRVKMEYHIVSGNVVETRRCWMTERDGRNHVRGQRKAGNTSMAKIRLNEQESVRSLARILNTNWGTGLAFVTLKYSTGRLPESYEEAVKNQQAFLRKLRAAMAKDGKQLRYIAVTANWSPKKDCEARLHHHLVLDIEAMDHLRELWPAGEWYVKVVQHPSDLTRLAAYLVANTHDLQKGQNKWASSRGLEKPVYTEPKPIEYVDVIQPLPDAAVLEVQQTLGEDGEIVGSYMRQWTFTPVKIRGGMVVMPRRRKKDPQPRTMDEAIWESDE